MRKCGTLSYVGILLLAATASAGDESGKSADGAPATGPPAVRVEARSEDLLAVGTVHGDRMAIHVSRLIDNAPVRDAAVNVKLRGVVHPTTAEADGSYVLQSNDLDLPGSAALIFEVARADGREELKGTLSNRQNQAQPEDKNTVRQLGWWVLNFGVCIGFLMLLARRRKAGAAQE